MHKYDIFFRSRFAIIKEVNLYSNSWSKQRVYGRFDTKFGAFIVVHSNSSLACKFYSLR